MLNRKLLTAARWEPESVGVYSQSESNEVDQTPSKCKENRKRSRINARKTDRKHGVSQDHEQYRGTMRQCPQTSTGVLLS